MKLKQIILEEIEKIGNDIILYHGSKHDFNKFDINKIGTGQHSQDFGYGLYFTTDKESAKFYANELSNFKTPLEKYYEVVNGNVQQEDEMLLDYIKNNRTISAKRRINELISKGIDENIYKNLLDRLDKTERYAYLYTVRIDDPKYIKRDEFVTIQRKLNIDDKKMNNVLKSKGFNGIIYPMNTKGLNTSRDFSGEKNVVIIDDSVISIIDKEIIEFGEPMKLKI